MSQLKTESNQATGKKTAVVYIVDDEPLFGDVVHLGTGLKSVYRSRREQVVDEVSLRLGAHPSSAMLRKQRDSDLEFRRALPPGLRSMAASA